MAGDIAEDLEQSFDFAACQLSGLCRDQRVALFDCSGLFYPAGSSDGFFGIHLFSVSCNVCNGFVQQHSIGLFSHLVSLFDYEPAVGEFSPDTGVCAGWSQAGIGQCPQAGRAFGFGAVIGIFSVPVCFKS